MRGRFLVGYLHRIGGEVLPLYAEEIPTEQKKKPRSGAFSFFGNEIVKYDSVLL